MSDILEQFNKWKIKLDKDVDNVLLNDVSKIAIEEMKNKIESEVYDKYTPTQYIRRYENGGLMDDKNINIKLVNNHTLIIQNVTDNGQTVETVETGIGYTWKNSDIYAMQPFPREFHKPAEEELINSGKVENALVLGLKNKGYK